MLGLSVPTTLHVNKGLEVDINTAPVNIYCSELNFFPELISGVKQLHHNGD